MKSTPARILFAIPFVLASQGCFFVRSRPRTNSRRRVRRPAPPTTVAQQPASQTFALVRRVWYPQWRQMGQPLAWDLFARRSVQFPVERGRCYRVVAVLDQGSTWPRSVRPTLQLGLFFGRGFAVALPAASRPRLRRTGRFDGHHPVAEFSTVPICPDNAQVGQLALEGRPRLGGRVRVPARALVYVLSRSLEELARQQPRPAGWPTDFLLLPGRTANASATTFGRRKVLTVQVDTPIKSPRLVDWFYSRLANRLGLKLSAQRTDASPGTSAIYSRIYLKGNEIWSVTFYRRRGYAGTAGNVVVTYQATVPR